MKLPLLLLLSLHLPPAAANDTSASPPGMTGSDWSGIRAAYERHRHAAAPVAGGLALRNPGQRWTTRCDVRGFLVTPDAGAWTWGLELQSYGFAGCESTPAQPPAVQAHGSLVTFAHDGNLEEWLVNDARGLEHGFMVRARPAHSDSSDLCFTLAVRGPLRAVVSANAAHLQNEAGATVLTYAGLKAWDADHRALPAHMEAGGGALRLVIDERGARYPLTIDPVAQQAYLKASNTGAGDLFGYSIAISGDTAVVGATLEDSTALNSGAAFVFLRTGSTWTQQAVLKAGNVSANGQFGWSVAIAGNTIVVGTPWEDTTATDSGAAYVFLRSGTTWNQQAMLKASNAGAGDGFGGAVSISGETVVVGAQGEASAATGPQSNQSDNSAPGAGAAYVFLRSGAAWNQQAYLKASNTQAGDSFGWSVAIAGDLIAVGAIFEDSYSGGINGNQLDESQPDSGAVYAYARSSAAWSQEAYIKANAVGPGDRFGNALALSGQTLVVGESWDTDGPAQAGLAIVYVRTGTTWSRQAFLRAPQQGAGDRFGQSVAISGDVIAIGAHGEASSATGINGDQADNSATSAGAVYLFTRSGTAWSAPIYVKASNTGAGDNFGWAVGVSGNTVISGAWLEDSGAAGVNAQGHDNAAANSGAAYVFTLSGGAWTQRAYLKAPLSANSANLDGFGTSVALSGDTAVIGAPFEDSAATGVNGNQADNSASNAGAAYVFVRNGTVWNQEAYLKASNAEAQDNFGGAVGVSGDIIIVGATEEDSDAMGVNHPTGQASNMGSNSGAAYIFVRSGGAWSQEAYVKASNPGNLDRFGGSVAASGETVVIGATDEDSTATGVNGIQAGNNAPGAGAAYVFVRSGGGWGQQAYLKASNTDDDDRFGTSVAIFGDTIAVGAEREDANDTIPLSGAAYVFQRNGTNWSGNGYLKAANARTIDAFGWSVAVASNTIIVGAPKENSAATGVNGDGSDNSADDAGAAYVFRFDGADWTQQAYLKASNTGAGDNFGYSVAISGTEAVIGARYEGSNATGAGGDQLNNGAPTAGAAYHFTRSINQWSQSNYLKASNTGSGDIFGTSVAIFGTTVLAGAPGEDSSARGVNGRQTDNTALDSGAAYTFDLAAPSCLEAWRQTWFGDPVNNGNGADLFDYDKDGQVNLMEFGTGQNPLVSTPRPFALTRNGSTLEFTWPRAKCSDGTVTWSVEWSDALTAWSTTDVTSSVEFDNGTVEHMKSTLPAGTAGKRYVRLRVTVP